MLIILSPAKAMDMSVYEEDIPATTPQNIEDAEYLAEKMKKFSATDLKKLLKISNSLAKENYLRYQNFGSLSNPRKQAIIAYNGSVFKELDAKSFTKQDFKFAQDRIRIISTLYGLVRPCDLIQPYRLAFPLKLQGKNSGDLYDYWQEKLTPPLIKAAKKVGGIIINLASKEVVDALNMDELTQKVKVINIFFQENRNGKYQTIRTYAKMARGAMTRHIILEQVEDPEELMCYEWEGFNFNEKLSDNNNFHFTREHI